MNVNAESSGDDSVHWVCVWQYCNPPAETTEASEFVNGLESHILKAWYELLRGEWVKCWSAQVHQDMRKLCKSRPDCLDGWLTMPCLVFNNKKVAISKGRKYKSLFSVPANGKLDVLHHLCLALEPGWKKKKTKPKELTAFQEGMSKCVRFNFLDVPCYFLLEVAWI